jgi:murein DD-endopeptidase MepM/ murein hydrolase activator NlpD
MGGGRADSAAETVSRVDIYGRLLQSAHARPLKRHDKIETAGGGNCISSGECGVKGVDFGFMRHQKYRTGLLRSLASPRASLYLSLGALFAGVGVHSLSPFSIADSLTLPIPQISAALAPMDGEPATALTSEIQTWWANTPRLLDPRIESFVMRRGDTLMDVLQRAGLDRTNATNVVQAIHNVYDPKRMQAGQSVDISYQPPVVAGDALPTALAFDVAPGQRVAVERAIDGSYAAKNIIAQTHNEPRRVEGVINSTLFAAAEEQGLPADVMTAMVKLFSYDVDFQRDLQKGDKFSILFDREVTGDGEPVRNGEIRYASMTLGSERLELYAFQIDGQTQYYNAKGEGIRKALMRTPINGATLTSGFGMRHHPILGYSLMHRGVDFGAPIGTPIMAAGDGVIEKREASRSYGNYLRVRHRGGYSTAYAHMSRFGKGMTEGRRVHQGEIIGYVGATGRATGPHLHFEILRDNKQVNPITVKFPSSDKLTGSDLARFQAVRTTTMQAFSDAKKRQTQTAALDTSAAAK